MADYYCEPNLYTYAATPTWGTAQEGDGTNGTGAVLAAVRTGTAVTSITITTAGTGYSTGTRVYFSGGGGSGATATITSVNDAGGITGMSVGAGGTGYTSDPTISLVPGPAIPAIGKVVFSAVPTTGTISVLGASVSTTSVIGAASADAAANALATNINATTNTVSASVSASTHQLRNMVYARGPSGGAPAGTCEIMTRAGSQSLNYATNANAAITETLDNCTATNFGEGGLQKGRSGAWGWLFNDRVRDATIWPQAKTQCTYGVFFTAAGAAPLMVVGSPGVSDAIIVRCNNVEQIIGNNSGSSTGVTLTRASNYVFDDGSVWIGDTGTFTFTLNGASGDFAGNISVSISTNAVVFASPTRGRLRVVCDARSSDVPTFLRTTSSCRVLISGAQFVDSASPNTNAAKPTAAGGGHVTISNCHFLSNRNVFTSPLVTNDAGYGSAFMKVSGCLFEWTAFTGTCGALIPVSNTSGQYTFEDCEARFNVEPSLRPTPFSFYVTSFLKAVASNMEGFLIPTSAAGIVGVSSGNMEDESFVLLQNVGSNRGFRLESGHGVLDWIPGTGYPVADSYLPNGTAWCYRFTYSNSTTAIKQGMVYSVINLTKTNILSAGARTIALELFVNDSYDHLLTDGHLMLVVSYTDNATGKQRTEFSAPVPTRLARNATALPSSSKSWTGNSYAGTHVARKITLTTGNSVAANSEISATLQVLKPASNLQEIFINPELTIT